MLFVQKCGKEDSKGLHWEKKKEETLFEMKHCMLGLAGMELIASSQPTRCGLVTKVVLIAHRCFRCC